MITDVIRGIISYFRALSYLGKGRLGLLAMAPGALGAALGAIYIYLAYSYSDNIAAWIMGIYPFEQGESTTTFITQWFTFILLTVLYFILLKYVILIIGGPFMSPFSERIEQIIRGAHPTASFSAAQFVKDIIRALRLNVRNLLREIGWTLLLLILSLFAALAPFTSIALFLVGAFYAGYGNLDFTMERHLNYKESVGFVKRNKGVALGNGIGFMVLFTIPVLGMFIALPLSAAAGTIETIRALDRENLLK